MPEEACRVSGDGNDEMATADDRGWAMLKGDESRQSFSSTATMSASTIPQSLGGAIDPTRYRLEPPPTDQNKSHHVL